MDMGRFNEEMREPLRAWHGWFEAMIDKAELQEWGKVQREQGLTEAAVLMSILHLANL